jgi:hypothetical protein
MALGGAGLDDRRDVAGVHKHLSELEQRIGSLTMLKAELERMIEGCAHGRVDQCRVIEVLADHGHCKHH